MDKNEIEPLVRILIVDDHKLFRALLKEHLESVTGFSVVAEAENGNDAVALVKIHRPHICIMDITLKGLDGFEATRKIRKQCSNTHVLAISASTKPESMRRMLNAGANGYLPKDSEPEALIEAVKAVSAGFRYYPHEYKKSCDLHGNDQNHKLSCREVQLLKLLSSNYSLKDIAVELDLAYSTVSTMKLRAMVKIGAQTTADLIRYCVANDIAHK